MKILVPSGARYACLACGRCCRTTSISLSEGEAKRLESVPPPGGGPSVMQLGTGAWRLRPRLDGACPYLGDDNLCALQRDHGYEAKPLACRLFPLSFLRTPGGLQVGLRFSCPAVAAGAGDPLDPEDKGLVGLAEETAEVAGFPVLRDPVPFDRDRTLPLADLEAIQTGLRRMLLRETLDLASAAAAAAEGMDLVSLSSLTAESRRRYWEGLFEGLPVRYAERSLVPPSPPNVLERIAFRQAIFRLGSVSGPEALTRGPVRSALGALGRAARGTLFMLGAGNAGRLRGVEGLEAVLAGNGGGATPSPDRVFRRFLSHRIETFAYFTDRFSAGPVDWAFRAHLFMLPLAIAFAKAAAPQGRVGAAEAVEGVVRVGDALSTAAARLRPGRGSLGGLLSRPHALSRFLALAAGSAPGEPVVLPG